jgi:hypothetical protein
VVVMVIAVWALWRKPSRSTLWERLALLVLAAGSISVQRNALFFGLFALMALPVWIAGERGARPLVKRRQALVNGALVGLALAAAAAGAAAALIRPASTIEFSYQRPGVLAAVQRAVRADPALRVLGDVRFDDWLLWRDPALHGRVAFDGSLELLAPGQLTQVQNLFFKTGSAWKRIARGYRLLVLDRRYEPATVRGFLSEPGRRVLYDDGERLVILRSASQAADE